MSTGTSNERAVAPRPNCELSTATREKRAELVRFLDWLREVEGLFLCGYETGPQLTETQDDFEQLAQDFLVLKEERRAMTLEPEKEKA